MPTRDDLEIARDDALWLRRLFIKIGVKMKDAQDHDAGLFIGYSAEWWRDEVQARVMRIARLLE